MTFFPTALDPKRQTQNLVYILCFVVLACLVALHEAAGPEKVLCVLAGDFGSNVIQSTVQHVVLQIALA